MRRKNDPVRAELQRQALALRANGATYEAIARRLGFKTASAVYKIVRAALLATVREPADELRALEALRLDRLMLPLWPLLAGDDATAHPERLLRAVDRLLAVMARRAELLGLDAPRRIDVEGMLRAAALRDGLDPDEMVREAESYLREQRR